MFKTFFLNLSLTRKLIFMMLFLTAILLVTLITIYWQSEKNLMAQIEGQTAELAQAVQVGVEEVTGGATSETRLEQYLASLKTKGIKEISIISNADEIIASTNPKKVGTPVSEKKKELIIKAELGEPAVDQEGKAYNVIIPVIAGQAHYGYIHLPINVENLQETMRRNTTKRIIAALSVFAIGILLSTFLSMWYTGPIHNVVEAARKVAAGDLNQVESELATLAAMDARIQRATAGAELAEGRQAVRNLVPDLSPERWPSLNTVPPAAPSIDEPQSIVLALPEVAAARRRVEAADAVIELRQRLRKPDPTLSLRGGQEADSTLVGINFSIPLYIRNSFSGELTAAVAERDQAQQLADDLLRRAYARFLSATERYRVSRETWASWEATGQPSLERQGDVLRRLWEAGEISTTEFLVQLRQVLDTRENALDLELAIWRAWFEWLGASGQVDAYGIPILKVHMAWGENERAMIPDMAESAAEMMEAAGAKNIQPFAVPDRVPGSGIHEVGVARMGRDPKTSVLNQYQQSHDVRNLFVMDGSGFTSGACQNPTLTIMALAVRSTDYLLGEMKRGSL